MTATLPEIADSGRYPIGKAADALGVHRNTLRRYTREGKIKYHLSRSGKYIYLGYDIKKFWRTYL